MARGRRPPSQSLKTFLRNHAEGIASIDFFVDPTATCKLLFGLLIISHERRQLVHVAVTANPTADWIARQIFETFPWDTAPRYLIRDRDGAYGEVFKRRVKGMGIRDRPTAPRSPWQNAYVERLIGSIRRECLDHLIIIGEAHLRRVLRAYADYYNRTLTHLSLNKDTPLARPILRDGRIKPAPLPRPLQNFVSPYPAQHLRDAERRDQLTRNGPIICRGYSGLRSGFGNDGNIDTR